MRVRLKGTNSITKKLADGTRRTYWYAWKGGPPLRGEPDSPEFVHSYNEAIAHKVVPPQGALLTILQGYQVSGEFLGRAERTRADYIKHIRAIEKRFGDFPLSALTDRRARHLHGMARSTRAQLQAASRLRLASARANSRMGPGPRFDHGQSLRAWWPTVPRQSRRQDLDGGRRGSISQICSRTSAFAVAARAVDRPAARRFVAPSLVGL